jgi:hypothetical protein
MPYNVIIGTPVQVMPIGLMAAFEEESERKALIDQGYAYGESTRLALTLTSRKRFRVSRRLTPAQADALRAFYLSTRHGQSFWFYNLRETQPPGSFDPTGGNPIGRYAVVWDSPLTQSAGFTGTVAKPARGSVSEYALREVAVA